MYERSFDKCTVTLYVQAIHCCLADVVPVDGKTWSEACINRFTKLAHQQLVTIVAIGTEWELPSENVGHNSLVSVIRVKVELFVIIIIFFVCVFLSSSAKESTCANQGV